MNKKKLKDFLSTSFYFLVVIMATFFIIKYVAQRTEVVGRSMEPTLESGDNLIVDKLTYHLREPERFEIVVFPYRDREGIYYIKRIIGIPGDTIQIKDGYVYVNEIKLEENYIKSLTSDAGIASSPLTLKEGEYFVMGDNRENSTDSRSVSLGIVKREELTGRAFMRIWPINKITILKHG